MGFLSVFADSQQLLQSPSYLIHCPCQEKLISSVELAFFTLFQGYHSFLRCNVRRIEEIRGGITNIFEEICQNLAQNLRRIEEIPHMHAMVDLTFAY